jgi:drug/metabolite transporter (DMT)-like permease
MVGTGLALACALLWGVQAVVSRQSVRDGLSAADVTVLRFGAAGLALLPVALKQGWPFPVGALGWRRGLVLTALAGAPYSWIIIAGAQFAPTYHAGIVGPAMIPVFATGLAWIVLHETPGRVRLVGLGLILAGLMLFGGQSFAGDAWRGDAMYLWAALMWALYGLLSRIWRVDAVGTTAAICVLSMATLPAWLLFLPSHLGQAAFSAMALQALYQGLLVGALSLFFYTKAIELIGPVTVTLFLPLNPIVASLAGGLLLGEWPSLIQATGMAIAVAGLTVALRN